MTYQHIPEHDINSNLPVVEVANLYKYFTNRQQAFRSGIKRQGLFDTITSRVTKPFTRNHPNRKQQFCALQDISFSINRGDRIAIIGRNGSGKTTLLRILSGMMSPSSGSAIVRGQFGILFALNTGFNMSLSGRKNVYLLCALYGYMPEQVDEMMEDIIEFSEIGQYIDLPVKDYSSGMRGRLGFSIMMKVLPDIVFIDEALSAGDESFQNKAHERLYRFKEENRTIVMVTHSMGQVQQLCDRAIWLDRSKMLMDGPAEEVVRAYRQHVRLGKSLEEIGLGEANDDAPPSDIYIERSYADSGGFRSSDDGF
jgi:ABC-type polysaccharide/polyol phosphate transport system ATPase subunit